jgi:hypothetical protein
MGWATGARHWLRLDERAFGHLVNRVSVEGAP